MWAPVRLTLHPGGEGWHTVGRQWITFTKKKPMEVKVSAEHEKNGHEFPEDMYLA